MLAGVHQGTVQENLSPVNSLHEGGTLLETCNKQPSLSHLSLALPNTKKRPLGEEGRGGGGGVLMKA